MRDEPSELTESGRNIAPALDRIVRHCRLEKDRDHRFQSAICALSIANVALGRSEAAIAAGEHGVAVTHRAPFFLGVLGWGACRVGPGRRGQGGSRRTPRPTRRLAYRRRRGLAARRPRADRRRLRRARTGGRGAPGPPLLHRIARVRSSPRRAAIRGVDEEARAATGVREARTCAIWARAPDASASSGRSTSSTWPGSR